MLARDLEEGAGIFLSATIQPLRSKPVIAKAPLLIGFDTEYRPEDGALLSVQFAVRSTAGGVDARVYYPTKPKLSVDAFAEMLFSFVRETGAPAPTDARIHLVAHFAQVELGGFENPLRDWNIREAGKAHTATLELNGPDDRPWSVRLHDLFGFFPTSLARIGASVGLEKLPVDAARIEELLRKDPIAFEAYAKRDAEIPLVALERFRGQMLAVHGIEVLSRSSIAAVASEIFRRAFLKTFPAPVRREIMVETRRGRNGYRQVSRRVLTFDGSSDVRLMAGRSYWGGRTEAFGQGLYLGPVVMRDVASLYPHAAILQPLPTEKTRWKPVVRMEDVAEMEGFGRFEFAFPAGWMYPCLPVVREGVRRLVFPRKGESHCTFAEVRAAVAMGATVTPIRAWGFHAAGRERDHDVARYMRAFLAQKNAAAKGSLDYETAKYLLNALIGKLNERHRGSRVVDFERHARVSGLPGVVALFAKAPTTRAALSQPVSVGSAWAPEWSTLILGKARALMAPIVARGALVVSTDAVLVPAGLSLDSEGLRELQGAGTDLVDEAVGDAAFIVRSRLYAVLRKPENLAPDQEVLARDTSWAVVKVARHGSPETKDGFAHSVLACLAARRDVITPVSKERLLGAKQAILRDRALNETFTEIRQTHLRWDGKRALRDRDVNIFTSFTGSDPYMTGGKLDAAEHQRLMRAGAARRARDRHAPAAMDRVLAMLEAGASARDVERETGVARSTVQDLKQRLRAQDEGDT